MKIQYPSEEQIRASVREICEQVPLTKRPTILSFLRDMSHNLGFRQIFSGTWDVIAICCTLFAVIGVVGSMELRTTVDPQQKGAVFLFAFSPVFLFLLFSLSIWKEAEGPVWPIKMACRYTVRHLMAFRVFCITCLSFAAVGFYTLVLSTVLRLRGLPLLCISLSSLFLYSLIQIQAALSVRSNLAACGLLALWVFGNCAAANLWPRFYWEILQAVPAVAWIAVDVLLAGLFCNRYKIYVRRACYAEGM